MSFCDEIYRRKYIMPRNTVNFVSGLKEKKLRISFTNGCFDILHPGHLDLLYYCKSLADILIVGLNSDESIKRLKGPKRPVCKLEHRIIMLGGYPFVDYLVSFCEDDPYKLIEEIKPDYLVKGADWGHGRIIGEDLVKSCGGKVISYPLKGNFSTSDIISRIREMFCQV